MSPSPTVPLLCALAFAACATVPGPPDAVTGTDVPVVVVDDLEERALLLLLADRKTYEPISIHQAVDGDADLRREAALTLGRIGDERAGPLLGLLLGDPAPTVRRAAAFALGELGEQGYQKAAESLLGAIADGDRETGRLAIEALAKLGVTLGSVTPRLVGVRAAGAPAGGEPPLAEEEIFARLLPSLFRFQNAEGEGDPEVLRWAERGLEAADPELRGMAAYALARRPKAEAAPLLRPLLADADPWVRGWAARALGSIGERADLGRMRPLLDDPEPGPVIQTLRAAARLLAAGTAAPPADWRPRLLELLADPRPGVRLTAIEAAGEWLLDDEIGAVLAAFVVSGESRERQAALLALAAGEDPRAAVLLLRLAADPDPLLRARAAEAAGLFRAFEVLGELAADADPRVRRAALETRLTADPEAAREVAAAALADPDAGVRATALAWAEEEPVFAMEILLEALAATGRDRILDARLAAARAFLARALAEPKERGSIVAVFEELGLDDEYLVRRQAARALAELDRDAPPVGTAGGRKPVATYREIVQRTRRPRRVEILTDRGAITVELACPEAPLTCLNFLQLTAQGYFDGLAFHRVVPDFVVQAGDPRGDGLGGPGYAIRDEMNLVRYRRGVLGMALSGPDTGGSQFFLTLSPQPHLDGGYTAFGRVVAGDEVLDRIVQGDLIRRLVEVGR